MCFMQPTLIYQARRETFQLGNEIYRMNSLVFVAALTANSRRLFY